MKYNRSVLKVYKNELCNSCGICLGVCTQGAISYKYSLEGFIKPEISKLCINCGKCLQYCPGASYYIDEKKEIERYYTVHSTNEDIRKNSASGGFTTEFLCYLLSQGIVDYCVVVPRVENTLKIKPCITDDIQIVKNAKGSKYLPIEYGHVLKEIKGTKYRYALVALPCQASMIKKFMKNEMERIIIITLMCNHISGNTATKMLLQKQGIKDENFTIDYRGNGWPGYMQINNQLVNKFRSIYGGGFGRYFSTTRCKLCDNHLGEDSAITVGDPYFWSAENKSGNTFCICRDRKLSDLIDDMIKRGIIEENFPQINEDVLREAYKGIYRAEAKVPGYLKIRKKIGKAIPLGSELYLNRRLKFENIKDFIRCYKDKLTSMILSVIINIRFGGSNK